MEGTRLAKALDKHFPGEDVKSRGKMTASLQASQGRASLSRAHVEHCSKRADAGAEGRAVSQLCPFPDVHLRRVTSNSSGSQFPRL